MRAHYLPFLPRSGALVAAWPLLAGALLLAQPSFAADDPVPAVAPAAVAVTAPAPATAPVLVLRGFLDQKVAFHGNVSYDGAGGGPGAMMYPAPGLAGLLVAVAAHAVVSSSMREAEKSRLREQADLILGPHQDVLNGFRHGELLLDAVARIASSSHMRVSAANGVIAPGEVVADSAPLFYMTQDRRALIMDNALSIRSPGREQPFNIIIRVVSPATNDSMEAGYWFNASGARLKETSAAMFSRSIDIAMSEMKGGDPATPVYKTVRYNEGGAERMERAQVVKASCDDLVLRTLRGNLMAVPRRAGDEPADGLCVAPQKS